jgi:WD40 repeat protein
MSLCRSASLVLCGVLILAGNARGDDTIKLGDVGRAVPLAIPAEAADTLYIATFIPGQNRLLTSGWQQPVRIWDTEGKQIQKLGDRINIDLVDFAPDGKLLAGASASHPLSPNRVSIWRLPDGKPRPALKFDIKDQIRQLRFLDAGTLAVITSRGPQTTVRTIDLESSKEVRQFDVPFNNWWRFAFSADARTLAAAGKNGTVYLYEVATGKELKQLSGGAPGAIGSDFMALGMSADGRLLAGADYCTIAFNVPGAVKAAAATRAVILLHLWDIESGRELRQWELPDTCFSLAFSPDGRSIVSRGMDATVLWETASGRERRRFATESWSGIKGASFSSDGTMLTWNEADGRAILLDLTGVRRGGKTQPLSLTVSERDELWSDLASADAAKGFRALQALAASAEAPAFVREHLPKSGNTDETRIARLVADLDHDKFPEREKAQRELEQVGAAAETALRKAAAEGKSLEARRRAEQILAGLKGGAHPGVLRVARSLELLERLATPEARAALEALAQGEDRFGTATDAKRSLERLRNRK